MASVPLKKPMSLQEKLALLDKVSDGINQKAGRSVIGRIGKDEAIADRLNIYYIPTASRAINEMTGGGYPRRRYTIITGMEDSGKTSRLLEDIGLNMKNDPNFIAGWLESEGSLKKDYLLKTFGIDPDRFIYLEVDREDAAEVAIDRVETILSTGACDMVVINSLKALVPKAEYEDSMTKQKVALQARMNSQMVRKLTALIAESNAAFVIVTHLTTDIGSMSRDPNVMSGGKAIRYASSVTLDFRKRSLQETDPISSDEGLKIGVTQKKNHCIPERNAYLKTEYFVVFGEGTEQILSVLEPAVTAGILVKKGSWIYWYEPDGETVRYSWQGKEKYRQFMRENPNVLAELQNLVNGGVAQVSEEELAVIKAEEAELEEAMVEATEAAGTGTSKKTRARKVG